MRLGLQRLSVLLSFKEQTADRSSCDGLLHLDSVFDMVAWDVLREPSVPAELAALEGLVSAEPGLNGRKLEHYTWRGCASC